jgi:hypothetical protein
MKEIVISRRALLMRACQLAVAAASVFIAGCAKKDAVAACAAPDQLSSGESSLRASLQYIEQASDSAKACRGCVYFHAAADADSCGKCEILNGAINAHGHCASWSANS